jgi:thiol-disulfide isomerase/thioredoxin
MSQAFRQFLRALPLFALLPIAAAAQEAGTPTPPADPSKGMKFEHDLSWSAILAKAKAENKYIFMDCFTTWCGPCKFMSTTIFPQEEVGNYFNDKFINVKVQLDTIAKDDAHVKSWYADAHAIMTDYAIRDFPTYLIFTPDGQPMQRLVGSTRDVKQFITETQESFDTTKQYYTQLAEFKQGRRDSAFLHRLALQATDLDVMTDATPIANAWFATQPSLYTPECLKLMGDLTTSTKDPGFDIFLHHAAEADAVLGAGRAERIVTDLMIRDYVMPKTQNVGAFGPDWKDIERSLAKKYPEHAPQVVAQAKVLYYQSKKDWTHFESAIVAYMQKYGAAATPNELNSYAWTVFQNCPDMTCVADALDWSKRSFKDMPVPAFMDTYANILYKMGKKDEAITWEQKALDMAADGEKPDYQATIDKMKKGEKTWN